MRSSHGCTGKLDAWQYCRIRLLHSLRMYWSVILTRENTGFASHVACSKHVVSDT